MTSILHSLALLSSGLFAGTCLYVALVISPARRTLPDAVALASFRANLPLSLRLQPALAAVGTLTTLGLTVLEPTVLHLSALALLAPIIPVTLAIVKPVYQALLAPELTSDAPQVVPLLERFAHLHALRTIVAVAGFALLTMAH